MFDLEPMAKTAEALSKPLVKLIEVVESCFGAIGRPFTTIVTAHAEGRAKLIREGYAHRLRALKARHRAELMALPPATVPRALPESTEIREGEIEVVFDEAEVSEQVADRNAETEQQAKRRANVVVIAAEAAEALPNDASEEPVDPDWAARFFTGAQDVSPEDLQRLWGKVLASEVAKPGCVPLRTLEILRNLTADECRLFERFASFCAVGGIYIPVQDDGVSARELMALQDAGLLESTDRRPRWQQIQGTDQDYPAAQARFADRFIPRMMGATGSYVRAPLRYRSGHVLILQAAHERFRVTAFWIRPSAAPLLALFPSVTSLDYLRAVVGRHNEQPYFQAWVLEPDGWAGEPFGEGTVPPASRTPSQ